MDITAEYVRFGVPVDIELPTTGMSSTPVISCSSSWSRPSLDRSRGQRADTPGCTTQAWGVRDHLPVSQQGHDEQVLKILGDQ